MKTKGYLLKNKVITILIVKKTKLFIAIKYFLQHDTLNFLKTWLKINGFVKNKIRKLHVKAIKIPIVAILVVLIFMHYAT